MGLGDSIFGIDSRSQRPHTATRLRALRRATVAGCLIMAAYCATGDSVVAQERVYIANDRSLAVIDTQSHALVDTIPLADAAEELAVTVDGARAYILFEFGVAVVDLRTAVTLDVLPISVDEDSGFYDLAVSASGDRACLAESIDGEPTVVWVIDTAQRNFLHGVQLATSQPYNSVNSLTMSRDGSRIYGLVNESDDDEGENATRSLVEIDAQSGTIMRSVSLDAGWGMGLLIVGDRTAYVGGAGNVSVVDLAAMSVSGSIPVGADSVEGVRAGSTGQSLFAWSGRTVSIIDPQRLQVDRTVTLDAPITDLAVRSDGNEIYAALSQAPAEIVSVRADAPITVTSTAVSGEWLAVAPAPSDGPPLPTPHPSPSPGPTQSYRAFVASGAALTLSEIDTGSPAVTAVARYGNTAISDLIAAADGTMLYGLTADGVLVLDPASAQVVDRIGLSGDWNGFAHVAVSPDGNTFWLARWSALARLDRRTGAMQQATYPFDGAFDSIALSADGRALYVTVAAYPKDPTTDYSTYYSGPLYVVDPSTLALLNTIEIYAGARDVTGSADGKRVYVATGNHSVAVVDTNAGRVVAMIATTTVANAIALSPDGAFAYVTGDSVLSVLDTGALREVASVILGDGESGGPLAVTPDGQRALVRMSNAGAGQVAVVDLSRLALIATLPVGEAPTGVVVLPGTWTPPPSPTPWPHRSPGPRRRCLFTAHGAGSGAADGTVTIVDPTQRGVAGSIRVGQWSGDPCPDGSYGYDAVTSIAIDPDGTRLYATTQPYGGGAGSLVALDPASRMVLERLYVGIQPVALAAASDGSRAYVLNDGDAPTVSVIDLITWRLLANIPVPNAFGRLALSPDGRRLYVRRRYCGTERAPFDCVRVIDTETNHIAGEVPDSSDSEGFALNPDGSILYIDGLVDWAAESYQVGIVDLGSQTMIGHIDITAENSGMAVSPDGHTLLGTSGTDPGTMAIIDLDGRMVRTSLAAGAFPESPVFGPDGDTAYVASLNGGIFELDVDAGRIVHGIATAGNVTDLVAAMVDAPCDALSPVDPSPTIPPTSTPIPTLTPVPTPTPVVWDCAAYPNGCVRIEVRTATGAPGATVQIEVRLATAGRSVARIQNDIEIDPPLSIAGDAREACRVNTDIDKAATAFAVRPAECAAGGCMMLRALVLAVDNTAPIADGSILYSCDVTIDTGASPGTYPLAVTNVGASDPYGKSLPLTSTDGAVVVASGNYDHAARAVPAQTGGGCAITPAGSLDSPSPVAALALLLVASRLLGRSRFRP